MSALLTQITQGKKRLTRPLIRLITSLSLVLFSFYCQTLQAQVISNAGAAMSISSGTVLNAVDIENTSGTITNSGTVTLTGNHSNAGTSAGDGTYNISGNWTNTGTFTAGSSTVNFNGGNAQSIGGSAATTFHNLTIANTNGGINLTNPESVDGSLSLSSGVLSTSATNILSLTNTSSAAITTASGTSYVSGPMKWSLASGSSYIFPLGKGSSSSTYFPFNLNTVSGTSPVVQVEAFASAPTGTADGTSLSALSSSEYWLLTMISGTFSGATVDLNRQTAVSPLDNIGRSTNDASLSYSALGGSGSGNAINGSNDIGSIASSGTNYFVMGQRSKIYNISTNNAFTGANTYCKNDGSPTNLSATFNTCTTGNGTPLATTVTVSWYYNTTNSTTIAGATQLAQTTGASTGTSGTVAFTYSPSTGTAGTFYYFAVLSAPSSNVCGFVTSLSTGTQLVTVAATPLAPTLGGASPTNGSTICQGYNSGAVTGIAGSGGSSGAADEYQLSINGGSSYASYTNGTAINTATASGSVIVQARRTGGSLACTTTSWTTLSTWTIGTSVVSPALNVASPASGTSICAGYNGPSATITAGSGGSSGTADLYEYSIDNGGSWATYTAGTAINTAGALSDVMIRVSRSAGSYGCSGSGTTTIATWPISTSPVGPALSTASPADGTTLCAGFNTGTVSGAAGSGGSSGAADAYRYSLDGGTSWASYTNGATINTSAATGNILVQSMRTSGSFGCSNTSWTTICSWTLGSPTQNPVLNVASPAGGTTICAGYTGPGATITPGSGGSTGASDLYEYSLDNGSNWLTYTPANQINTTGATSNVLIRVSRSGGSYGCNASGPTTIVTWPVSSSTTYPALNTATPPNGRAICAGYSGVNATITAGSGGSAGAADEYEISTAGALGTFNTYASGASINTSGATDTIIVRARRTGGNFGCTGSSWSTISYWPIGSASSLPTLTTPTPSNGTTVCIGNSSPNATIHAGSGGSYSAADLNEFSIDNGGNWSAYTSGNTISLTGASVNVLIRVRRSGGSYGCSDIGPSTIVTWPVAPTPAAPTGSAAQSVCTGSTLADLTASGTAIQWYTASSGGLLLPGSTVITNGSTYYASQTQSFCESISRLLVTASLYPSGRWIGVVSTDWSEPNNWCGGVPTSSTDALIPSGVSHYPTVDITTAICRDITINSGATLTIAEAKALHVTGVLTNSNGNSGLKLNSSSAGTGSLLHSTNNVPATVDRYISGSAEDWHFLSSPVAAQVISTGTGPGTWTPSGTYGNGTGYDLYTWDEAASCWVFQLNTNLGITPNWPTYHPESYFKPGCGYLYSLQLAAQTKTPATSTMTCSIFR